MCFIKMTYSTDPPQNPQPKFQPIHLSPQSQQDNKMAASASHPSLSVNPRINFYSSLPTNNGKFQLTLKYAYELQVQNAQTTAFL